jgi:hypothetical protein
MRLYTPVLLCALAGVSGCGDLLTFLDPPADEPERRRRGGGGGGGEGEGEGEGGEG